MDSRLVINQNEKGGSYETKTHDLAFDELFSTVQE